MYTPTKLKRLVACQGSIQLITALSALTCREKEQQGTNVEYDNYLVIYDLRTPENQSNTFANFIKKMAEEVCTWRKIVYIQLEQMQALQAKLNLVKLNLSNIQQVFSLVHKLTGISSADEIYLTAPCLNCGVLIILLSSMPPTACNYQEDKVANQEGKGNSFPT